jgi:predicted alpha/beta-hydrolase family hydrolase
MELLISNPMSESKNITLILAHGAGAPMDSGFMASLAALYREKGITLIRFEFPYMQERRTLGKKRPPDRAPKLITYWMTVVDQFINELKEDKATHLFIGGKSMGGRMATMLLAEYELPIEGCICFGYPYHPPGKPNKVRNEHFKDIEQSMLILQGERDTFGTKEEVLLYPNFSGVTHHWLKDGNHDLKPRKSAGVTHEQNIEEAVSASVAWMLERVTVYID